MSKSKKKTHMVSRSLVARSNNWIKDSCCARLTLFPSKKMDVSVIYSGKIIGQRLTSQDVRLAYKSAIEGIHGKEIQ